MNVNQVVRTITIKGVSDGVEKLTSDVNKLAAAQQNVAVVSETSARRVLSLEDAWKKQTLKLDEAARSQANIARESKIADGALREGLITQQQHAERLNLIAQRYAVATVQAGKFAGQTGLNRYELLNLSRQLQDVGVSLASGQSPFVVLTQQGSQILDVFQASTGSVRGFFTQVIGWAGRFVASTAGAVTGAVGIGAAALYAASSWSSGQREITRALAGIGAASGVTRTQINQIATATSSAFGLSVSEAREAATAYAATGRIYAENISQATQITKDFARATGTDAAEASKVLAQALTSPSKGAVELNKTLGFLDAATLNYIRSLEMQGRRQEAQKVLMDAAVPTIGRMAEQTGGLARAWDGATTAVSNYWEAWKRATARTAERATGADLGGFSDEERLGNLRARQSQLQSSRTPGLAAPSLRAVTAEIEQLEAKLRLAAEAAGDARFNQISIDADAAARSIVAETAQIERLTAAISEMEQAQAARAGRGLGADPGLESAVAIARTQLALAMETEQVEARKAQVFAQNAVEYSNVSASTAQTLATLKDQLGVAAAVGGAAQIEAQHRATINEQLRQGKALVDAMAIADAQRAIALVQIRAAAREALAALQDQYAVSQAVTGLQQIQAQAQATYNQLIRQGVDAATALATAHQQANNALAAANAEADRMLRNLQQQGQLLQASSQYEKDRIQAAHTYTDLIEKGVDAEKARAVAAQQLRNADLTRQAEEAAEAERDAARSAERHARANEAAAAAAERNAQAAAEAQRRWEAAAAALKFLPFYLLDTLGAMDKLFNSNQFGKSQFNPEGYSIKTLTPTAVIGQQLYGPDGLNPDGTPNARGMQYYFDKMLQKAGGDFGSVASSILGGGLMTSGGLGVSPTLDTNKVNLLNRAIDVLPKEQQTGYIQQEISLLNAAPKSLETAELINQLNEKLAQLTQATDANTAATSAMTDVLSPYYSQDPRRTHLGFRPFAGGGIMTQYGELPLKKYDGGGVAYSPQVAMFGEGSTPEAYVPVPSGRIPVEMRVPANSNQPTDRPIVVNVRMTANVSRDEARKTGFHIAQEMKRRLG